MLRCVALSTLFLATSPVVAAPRHFVGNEDGISFDYTADVAQDGKVILRGTSLNPHEDFVFTVSPRGHVDGWVGSTLVSFDVSQRVRDRVLADLQASKATQLAQSVTTH